MKGKATKVVIIAVISLFVLFFLLVIIEFGPVRVEDFVLADSLPHGWVVIEYERPDCPPLPKRWLGNKFEIPESGYLCTSDSPQFDLTYSRFFVKDTAGRMNRIDISESIWFRTTVNPVIPCDGLAEVFWYGPREEVSGDRTSAFKKWRDDCSR